MMKRIRVLVVDDSALVRELLTAGLAKDPELEVVGSAANPYIARDKIVELRPDVLTLDVEMPRMDGYELATAMKADPRMRNVPIIMITSRTGDKHRQRAMDLGVERYLGKPYQEVELMRNVFELLKLERGSDGSLQ